MHYFGGGACGGGAIEDALSLIAKESISRNDKTVAMPRFNLDPVLRACWALSPKDIRIRVRVRVGVGVRVRVRALISTPKDIPDVVPLKDKITHVGFDQHTRVVATRPQRRGGEDVVTQQCMGPTLELHRALVVPKKARIRHHDFTVPLWSYEKAHTFGGIGD